QMLFGHFELTFFNAIKKLQTAIYRYRQRSLEADVYNHLSVQPLSVVQTLYKSTVFELFELFLAQVFEK
ncbi:MAG: hypothetical protein VXY56_13450, partial [Pseudomonadota bacterium]|nr:hypothetical protein [Pseudomonadota bacterium]